MNNYLRHALLAALAIVASATCSSGDDKPTLATGQVRQAAGPCTTDLDCDDNDICTSPDTCVSNVCQNPKVAGCCNTAADCDDQSFCTTDTCDTANFACSHTKAPNCCTGPTDCDDTNPCTTDTCTLATGACGHAPVTACCKADA